MKQTTDNTWLLVSADNCIMKLDRSDTIENFVYKLPIKYAKFWRLFNHLGSNESLTLEKGMQVLDAFHQSSSLENSEISETQFNSVLIILKRLFLFGTFKSKHQANAIQQKELYLPNMSKKMLPLSSMYYIDNFKFEHLINRNCQQLKSKILFDINELVRFVESSFSKNLNFDSEGEENANEERGQSDRNILSSIGAFKYLTWVNLLNRLNLPPNQMPKPLSLIFVESLIEESSQPARNDSMNNRLHSPSFAQALVDLINLLNNFSFSSSLETKVVADKSAIVSDLMQSIVVYECDQIRTHYMDLSTNQVVKKSEKTANFACLNKTWVFKLFDSI